MSRIPEDELLAVLVMMPQGPDSADTTANITLRIWCWPSNLPVDAIRDLSTSQIRYRLGLLEKRGLVQRERDQWGCWLWCLTDAGIREQRRMAAGGEEEQPSRVHLRRFTQAELRESAAADSNMAAMARDAAADGETMRSMGALRRRYYPAEAARQEEAQREAEGGTEAGRELVARLRDRLAAPGGEEGRP